MAYITELDSLKASVQLLSGSGKGEQSTRKNSCIATGEVEVMLGL